MPKDKLKLY